jgi:hypothetical protein
MTASAAPSASLLVIIAIICLTIGYVFGWVISSSQRARMEKKESPEPTPVPPEPVVASPEPVAEKLVADRTAWLRLTRATAGGGLVVEATGKAFGSPSELSLADRQEIESALRATADWMGLAYHLGEPAPVAEVHLTRDAAPIPVASVESPNPAVVISGMTNALADALQPTVKKEVPKSIVEQIDSIFQGLLVGTPYEDQKVYIAEDPKRGVIVRVGNQVYEGVGAVPEGEVKKLLRNAVAEWERQQEQKTRRVTT